MQPLPREEESLRLHFPALQQHVSGARRCVADWARRRALAPDDVEALMLAVGEACNNAVSHGGGGAESPVVIVSCRAVGPCGVQVDVRNQGNGFHPDVARLAALPEADAFATSGRGFALMCALMDHVEVFSQDGDTIVRLTKG